MSGQCPDWLPQHSSLERRSIICTAISAFMGLSCCILTHVRLRPDMSGFGAHGDPIICPKPCYTRQLRRCIDSRIPETSPSCVGGHGSPLLMLHAAGPCILRGVLIDRFDNSALAPRFIKRGMTSRLQFGHTSAASLFHSYRVRNLLPH